MNINEVSLLAGKYLDGTATTEEQEHLHQWYDTVNRGDTEIISVVGNETPESVRQAILTRLLAKILEDETAAQEGLLISIPVEKPEEALNPVKRSARVSKWFKWVAAAVLLLLAGGQLVRHLQQKRSPTVAQFSPPPPGQVMLKLANGRVVPVNQMNDGAIAQDAGASISKQQSVLIYDPAISTESAGLNVLTVPAGNMFKVVLQDGTKIWLNAASELKYPTAFTQPQRVVEVTGEAFFEVAKNAGQPFIVRTGEMEVEVLGTGFNIMAYADEPVVKTTLLTGSIRVKAAGNSSILKPGEQAAFSNNNIAVGNVADVTEVTAWKDGLFAFRKTGIATILREISRWYNVEVRYKGAIPELRHTGKIPRSYSLSETMAVLEASGLRFRMEGNRVVVLP